MKKTSNSLKRIQIQIKGMHCAACSNRIERVLSQTEGIESVGLNLASETMDVEWDPRLITLDNIIRSVEDLGFKAKLPTREVTITLSIKGMHCASCSTRIEKVTSALDGVSRAEVNLATETGFFVFDPDKVTQRTIRKAIREAGYETRLRIGASSLFEEQQKDALQRLKAIKRRLVPAFLFAFPLFVISMGHMLGMPLPGWLDPDYVPFNFALAQFLLALPVIWSGRNFYLNGFPSLWRRSPNMDSLVAIGTGAAFIYSTWNLIEIGLGVDPFTRAGDLYFESAAVLIALISLGKYLEFRSKLKTTGAIKALMQLSPETTTLLKGEEQTHIPVEEVEPGDLLLIKPGERIPVDGTVVKGLSSVDESMLTGESIPVMKKEKDSVIGGTLNKNGVLTMRAERVGEDTMLSRIIQLVQQAQGSKAPIANLADRISFYFVPAVMAVAVLSGLAWYLIGGSSFAFALGVFIAVLVIACPCAMGLATPTSIMVGTGRGARLGVLIKSGRALQAAGNLQAIVFDKTGTLTYGKPEVTDCHILPGNDLSEDEIFTLAGSAESVSEHPLAEAVVQEAKGRGLPLREPEEFEAIPGRGIKASVRGQAILIGNREFLDENSVDGLDDPVADGYSAEGKTNLYIAVNSRLTSILAIADKIKDDAKRVVSCLKDMGLKVVMLTGDNEKTAEAIARQASIETVIAGVLPNRKSDEVRNLQGNGKAVAMVGDGINDAPALAQADLGIAMGSGIDVAIESGDIVLMKSDLSSVLTALNLSRATMRNIKQNLFWAFAYNTIGIPIAAGLLHILGGPTLNPMIAGTAMAMSSVAVVSNALRLRFFKG